MPIWNTTGRLFPPGSAAAQSQKCDQDATTEPTPPEAGDDAAPAAAARKPKVSQAELDKASAAREQMTKVLAEVTADGALFSSKRHDDEFDAVRTAASSLFPCTDRPADDFAWLRETLSPLETRQEKVRFEKLRGSAESDHSTKEALLADLQSSATARENLLRNRPEGELTARDELAELLNSVLADGKIVDADWACGEIEELTPLVKWLINSSPCPVEDAAWVKSVLEPLGPGPWTQALIAEAGAAAAALAELAAREPDAAHPCPRRERMAEVLKDVVKDGRLEWLRDELEVTRGGKSLLFSSDRPVADFEWMRAVLQPLVVPPSDGSVKERILRSLERTAQACQAMVDHRPGDTDRLPERARLEATLVDLIACGELRCSTSYSDELDRMGPACESLFATSLRPLEDLHWLSRVLRAIATNPDDEQLGKFLAFCEKQANARASTLGKDSLATPVPGSGGPAKSPESTPPAVLGAGAPSRTDPAAEARDRLSQLLAGLESAEALPCPEHAPREFAAICSAAFELFGKTDRPKEDLEALRARLSSLEVPEERGRFGRLKGEPGHGQEAWKGLLAKLERSASARQIFIDQRPEGFYGGRKKLAGQLSRIVADGELALEELRKLDMDDEFDFGRNLRALIAHGPNPLEDLQWVRSVLLPLGGADNAKSLLEEAERAATSAVMLLEARQRSPERNAEREEMEEALRSIFYAGELPDDCFLRNSDGRSFLDRATRLLTGSSQPLDDYAWMASLLQPYEAGTSYGIHHSKEALLADLERMAKGHQAMLDNKPSEDERSSERTELEKTLTTLIERSAPSSYAWGTDDIARCVRGPAEELLSKSLRPLDDLRWISSVLRAVGARADRPSELSQLEALIAGFEEKANARAAALNPTLA